MLGTENVTLNVVQQVWQNHIHFSNFITVSKYYDMQMEVAISLMTTNPNT